MHDKKTGNMLNSLGNILIMITISSAPDQRPYTRPQDKLTQLEFNIGMEMIARGRKCQAC